jgi:ABC-type uncharacterized transport system permease subunit
LHRCSTPLGIHFWQTRWRETRQPLLTLPMQPWERAAIFGALAVQGVGLYAGLFSAGGMRFSFSFALSLMLWLAVLIYWLESFRSRMDGLQPMVLPLAAIAALAPALFPQLREVANANAWGFQLHFLTAMLAYSLFTLSALHAVFMGFAERKLHQRAVTRSLTSLPPILTMEALLFRMILVAFCLLTAALVSGVMFSEALFGKAMVSITRPCLPLPRGESLPPCWSGVACMAGAAVSRCAGHWPDSWCCCWRTSAAALSPKSCSVDSEAAAYARPDAGPVWRKSGG